MIPQTSLNKSIFWHDILEFMVHMLFFYKLKMTSLINVEYNDIEKKIIEQNFQLNQLITTENAGINTATI